MAGADQYMQMASSAMGATPYGAMAGAAASAINGAPSSASSKGGDQYGETGTGSIKFGGVNIGASGINLNSPWVWGAAGVAALIFLRVTRPGRK